MKKVVVVESPAKAKTINRYLGNDYIVLASYGHIRDLPSKNGSVLPDQEFKMFWEMDDRAKKNMNDIEKALKGADELLLATDPDREGEAISWHVQEFLKEEGKLKGMPVKRIVFNEITKTAIQNAIKNPREINQQLVDAYLARRALDYLVGFTLSPVLWRKLPGSRSAGRVQSVALRLIVQRELEIETFNTQEYWSVAAQMATIRHEGYTARLTHLNGKKLDKLDLKSEEEAKAACNAISSRLFKIASVDKKQTKRHPAAPFTTSTLQQEAARKLGFGTARTMQLAQKLYEGIAVGGEVTGLITYMRTDSVDISKEAIVDIRQYIDGSYGQKYLPDSVRLFKNKSKNAQEAHEAIRPTSVLRKPEEVQQYLDPSQYKLYELIWKRTVASQMESALFDQVAVDVISEDKQVTLRANGSTLVFDGFLKLYQEGQDDVQDGDDDDRLLPIINQGEDTTAKVVTPSQHFTQPPPRFSEASLVKKLEELGIGRPSTYASIVQVLQDRNYVRLEKRQFIPEERGYLVTTFLVNFFKRYVEYDFTANLEEQLDDISNGSLYWKNVMGQFWKSFKETVDQTQELSFTDVLDRLDKDLSFHLFHSYDEKARVCPKCNEGRVSLKLSRYGAFLGCSNYPTCKYTKRVGGEEGDTEDMLPVDEPKVLGLDPETGEQITLRKGPYGVYLQWGETQVSEAIPPEETQEVASEEESTKKIKRKKVPKPPKPKRISLPAGYDPQTLTLTLAMGLKALPRQLGSHPESGEMLSVSVGRFGPYVKCGDVFASIPKSEDMFTIGFDRALVLVDAKIQKNLASGKVPGKARTKATVKSGEKSASKSKTSAVKKATSVPKVAPKVKAPAKPKAATKPTKKSGLTV